MADTKPSTSWAAVSLVGSTLGCLGALVWLVSIAGPPVETTGVSAGLAVLYVGFPSGTLCLLGVIFGVVALGRIRSGECRGGGMAWTGIVLGCLPFALFFTGSILGLWRVPW
ncbi:MAG: DUF4190 domain-containing protein [Pirellulales bacterium]